MNTASDLTFFTNDHRHSLLDRFRRLIKDAETFDVLVGYFYTSGFHALRDTLENTRKIRILIGISASPQVHDLAARAQQPITFSHARTKENFATDLANEMATAKDSQQVEDGITRFLEWLRSGKLEIRACPSARIHAKLYIMSFPADDRDTGRVITGSSNFTASGLTENLEFNVELKNRADYEFAKDKFEQLWRDAVDIGATCTQTMRENTWLNDSITPYHLYLKFLYEYFKDELGQPATEEEEYLPKDFKRLEYQQQAVRNAHKILLEYGGVFLSDVVGLGKTYMSAMLARRLGGRNLVIAPPSMLDAANPGSWRHVFNDFNLQAECESLGRLPQLARRGTDKYHNIFIDEAHRFRTETNISHETLTQICRGKRVILVTATPFNNRPTDILSQIKLFQPAKKSTIPNVPDIENFFHTRQKRISNLDRGKNYDQYMHTVREASHEIREHILKHLMLRRTRTEIQTHFAEDLEKQKLQFPTIHNPKPVFYRLTPEESRIFDTTVTRIAEELHYARYTPMLHYQGKEKIDQLQKQSQRNLARFMKILLIKRLESSFHAFRQTLHRFITYYEIFLGEFEAGNVYVSKKHDRKLLDLLQDEDDNKEEAIQKLIDSDKVKQYPASDFSPELKTHLQHDLQLLQEMKSDWQTLQHDPKLEEFLQLLATDLVIQNKSNKKLLTFTESKETAEYLADALRQHNHNPLLFTSASSAAARREVIENFDARANPAKSKYKILIATEILSEGVSLHAANMVINYDIPWNPTRLMQRVGRVNRVDTNFRDIHTFNFFPTDEANSQIKLKESAQAKIHAFIKLLGADAPLLTEGEEMESHELFNKLTSAATITGEDDTLETDLKYLKIISDIRKHQPDLFEQIKRLPKKARTAKRHTDNHPRLLTYFRKGKLQKFFISGKHAPEELDFMSAARLLQATPDDPRQPIPRDFHDNLARNKLAFASATDTESQQPLHTGGHDTATRIQRIIKATADPRQYTEEQETLLRRVQQRLADGALPKQTQRTTHAALNRALKNNTLTPLQLIAILQKHIPTTLLQPHMVEKSTPVTNPTEVILSEYLLPA